ncbi:hypothetical protein, partial [Chromobacterium subtsugae]|uniref:hypothetical protein n=1 Tax=Chromobacterium subtsugae TaxID=251747 RepID=UPI000640CA36
MQRAHALRLIITNWKGILFHCFEIDRHLTGLQGPNGAGKTTVMAAYLTAIIPNLRFLSFKNVTSDEAGKAGDATLWGRLGEGPCYTLLEWQTPKGTRLWAGVLLTRGNMPHIDLKLFTLEGLPEMVDPYDAFLVRDSSLIRIPTYQQLKDHLALLGGKVTTHSTLQNYMRALYEAGITPMPMMNYEEQERFYRILASSMSGSSLATLTRSGLRNYLFTEDQSLERRVTNLRECLGQCRHTRHELDQASSAHAEISGLFDAGWKMSSYAYYGALSKYGQTQQKWNDQKVLVREERATAESLQADLKRIVQEEVDLKDAYQAADKAVTKAIEERDRTKTAWELRIEIENRAERLIDLEAESLQAKTALEKAQADETAATTADKAASAETSRISRELGDLNKAVEALVKRAMLFEAAQKCLAAAQAALNNSKLRPDEAKAYNEEYDARYDNITEHLTRTEADLDAFDDQKKNFYRLLVELNRILADDGREGVGPQEAYPEALRLDSWLREMQALAATAETLSSSLIRTKQLASQQATIQEAARTLGITSRAALEDDIALTNATSERLEAEKQVQSDALAETNQQIADIKEALPDLEEAARQFRRASELRTQLGDGGVALEETQVRTECEALWHTWQQAAEEVHESRVQLESSIRRIRERIDALRSQSGMLDQRIGALAEHLDGTLFASYFDELSAEDAAVAEARLGTWVEAIVVSAPALAAKQATEFLDRPDNLLFVAEEAVSHQREAQSVGDSEIIEEHLGDIEGVRVTRRPERPALGRRAREAEIARLEGQLSADEARLRDLSETELLWKRRISLGNQLLALGKGAWAPDPEPTLTSEKSRLTGLEIARNSLKNTLVNFERQLAEVATRKKKYQSLEPQKDLIDPPNYAEEVRRLSAQLEAAQAAQDRVQRFHGPVQTILKDLPILRKVPDSRERERLAAQVNEWSKQRVALNIKRDSLASLVTVLPHFAYAEEKRVHDEQSSIMESLQAQLDVAEGHRERTLKYLEVMREGLRKAHDAYGEAYRQHQVIGGEQAKAKNNFKTLGLQGTDEELEFAKATVQNTATARDAAYDRHQKASEQKGRLETALDTANKALAAAQSKSWDAFDTIRTERRALRELRKNPSPLSDL